MSAEPDNPYDRFAVEIFYKGVKPGYVPRTDNKHISRLLCRGANVACRIEEVNPINDPWDMVKAKALLAAKFF